MQRFGVSERFACRVLGQHRTTQRKIAKTPDDEIALTAAIIALATQYGRYGYRPDHWVAARCWLDRQFQACRADLAAQTSLRSLRNSARG